MNTFKTSCSLLFLVLFLMACSNNADNVQKAQITEQNNLPAVQSEVKISVTLPDGWVPVNGSVLEHQYMKGTASFMIKNEYVLDGKKISDAIAQAKNSMERAFDHINFGNTNNLSVDNHDAVGLNYVYSVKAGGTTMNMKMYEIYTMVNEKCYVISFANLEKSFDALSTDIQAITEGIKFIN